MVKRGIKRVTATTYKIVVKEVVTYDVDVMVTTPRLLKSAIIKKIKRLDNKDIPLPKYSIESLKVIKRENIQ